MILTLNTPAHTIGASVAGSRFDELFGDEWIWLMHFLNRPFEKVTSQNGETPRTIEEISALAGLARLSREINRHQERIIKGASMLSQLPLEKVMIPAGKATFLSTAQSVSQAFNIALEDLICGPAGSYRNRTGPQ